MKVKPGKFDLGLKILIALREADITQTELAKKTGIKQNSISRYVANKVNPSYGNIRKVAHALNKPLSYFDEGPEERESRKPHEAIIPSKMLRLPLLGTIPAGKPAIVGEGEVEAWYELPIEFIGSETEFLLRVKGDSMMGEGILPGMYVGVSQKTEIRNGDIVVINIDDGYTLKRYYEKDGIVTLQAANKDVAPIIIGPKQHHLIRDIAKVTWYGRRLG